MIEGTTRVCGPVINASLSEGDMRASVALDESSVLGGIWESSGVIGSSWFHAEFESKHEAVSSVIGLAVGSVFALSEDVRVMRGLLLEDLRCLSSSECHGEDGEDCEKGLHCEGLKVKQV